ncbi:hypothetical protein [Devosia sp.]|uniref:hypothetical protein n=1 Tax=Devosia sp. TaxID=1871048 RepID=UPI003A912505
MSLPATGDVLGVDVGMSPTRRSSAVCRLSWTPTRVSWVIRRFRATPEERQAAMAETIGTAQLLAAAFDGPFRAALDIIGVYRACERLLTRRDFRTRIGKPGQSSAPIGRALNEHTNYCIRRALPHVADARHPGAIHGKAVVEAFPSSFMGLMLAAPETIAVTRGNRSDLFFRHLVAAGTLDRLLGHLLPGRAPTNDLDAVTNHDDRAALICALTALGVAAGDFVSVGDAEGRIILPPRPLLADWARVALDDPAVAPSVLASG